MDHACYDIREGDITRKEAIDLVFKYDGKCSENYIKKFCDYIDISTETFWNTVEKFRGDVWFKNKDGKLQNNVWVELEKIH